MAFPPKVIIYPSILLLFAFAGGEAGARGPEGTGTEAPRAYGLYPDIDREQSDMAHAALDQAYSADPKSALRTLAALRELEAARGLPPLSRLLSVAVGTMRYQNGDFGTAAEERALLEVIAEDAEQGRYLCGEALRRRPDHPTYLLILGGIRGFLATLKIHPDPSQALGDGFQALKLLEKARERDGRIKDSYMGTGIFHCTAANAPLFVRATLKIIGRSVNMRAGLEALRMSAYEGQYTSVASQLFLIQFLSPYEEELKREKLQIFRTLEERYPENPYYTFLRTDEALSFHPDSFFRPESRLDLERRIAAFRPTDFAGRRYANLVKLQYALLDPDPGRDQRPDTGFVFRDYAYYPVFLQAVRFKRNAEDSLAAEGRMAGGGAPGSRKAPPGVARVLKRLRDECLDRIAASPMNPTRKRLYQWHVTDALRWKPSGDDPEREELESVTGTKLQPRKRLPK